MTVISDRTLELLRDKGVMEAVRKVGAQPPAHSQPITVQTETRDDTGARQTVTVRRITTTASL